MFSPKFADHIQGPLNESRGPISPTVKLSYRESDQSHSTVPTF